LLVISHRNTRWSVQLSRYLAIISYLLSVCKKITITMCWWQNIVTCHTEYKYLNPHHPVALISWQLYITKLTVASHYNPPVHPYSNVTSWWLCIFYCIMECRVYVNTTCTFVDFVLWLNYYHIFSFSKHVSVGYIYQNASYYSTLFVINLYFLSLCLCSIILWQPVVFYSVLVLYVRANWILKWTYIKNCKHYTLTFCYFDIKFLCSLYLQ
jgi:hypothetical protein